MTVMKFFIEIFRFFLWVIMTTVLSGYIFGFDEKWSFNLGVCGGIVLYLFFTWIWFRKSK
jgi:hypothetical protein